jgi:hypothetical protein
MGNRWDTRLIIPSCSSAEGIRISLHFPRDSCLVCKFGRRRTCLQILSEKLSLEIRFANFLKMLLVRNREIPLVFQIGSENNEWMLSGPEGSHEKD